jgi:pullulanase-type alpha-1,6-glucosidase
MWVSGVVLALAAGAARADAERLADCNAATHARTLVAVPAAAPRLAAEGIWLDARTLRWPGAAASADGIRWKLAHAAQGGIVAVPGTAVSGAGTIVELHPRQAPLPATIAQRFKYVAAGATLELPGAIGAAGLKALHRGQLLLVQEDAQGRVLRATRTQAPAALDALYGDAAERLTDFGATPSTRGTGFRVWAPTAQAVALCLHRAPQADATAVHAARLDAASGSWRLRLPGNLSGTSFTWLVDVFVPDVGLVRNRVTDPYALSLTADSRRTWVLDLNDPATQPAGWAGTPHPQRVRGMTDLVIYELHVRDFSIDDSTVPAPKRGRYGAFQVADSAGMKHLKSLAAAGLTDVHFLPVFDLATVPETGCTRPDPAELAELARRDPATPEIQARVMKDARRDCFNWGYDPFHFTAPEGSFSSDAADGTVRIREFRAMVQALHSAGLRVGMDVVYNHMSAAGQHPQSVLDRIVPGYYHRLDAKGGVERSTCCDNTATEHRMMAKLMIDSAVVWARDHRIDSFRFDLMGHQPREAMERLQAAVNRASGRTIQLIGEGWNFGEVANGARFVQASQLSLNGSGIATFSDRGRDAARGGGCCDSGLEVLQRQGWLNGLHADRNEEAAKANLGSRAELLAAADLVRAGLAGTLRRYRMTTADGSVKALEEMVYAGQIAGYASEPGEVVNYVENHDNQTLYDLNAFKLPLATSLDDRARVQVLGVALTAFSQGVAYLHAGIELLRSKSLDRNSYDSGDWFNRLDYTFNEHAFGTGLPPEGENAAMWPLMKPVLARAAEIRARPDNVRFARDATLDLLRIRASTPLFRLGSSRQIEQRLTMLDTGPAQHGASIVAHLDGRNWPSAAAEPVRFAELVYAVNADKAAVTLTLPTLRGKRFVLHPVHRSATAADKRPAEQSRWDPAAATLVLPPRTALVYVIE